MNYESRIKKIIKNWKLEVKNSYSYKDKFGFTLIELLVVFSIISILSTIGIASFTSYSRQQILTNAVANTKDFFYTARNDALNGQKKDCPNNDSLVGYQVVFCCSGSSCSTCISNNDYEMDILCSDDGGKTVTTLLENSKKYPTGVSLYSSTATKYTFYPLSGGVSPVGSVTFSAFGQTKTISISQNGIIQ